MITVDKEKLLFISLLLLGFFAIYSFFSSTYLASVVSIISIVLLIIFFKYQHNEKLSITVDRNLIQLNRNSYKAVLVVEDIRADYRDFTETSLKSKIASFYKIIGTVNGVDLILRKIPIDKTKYLDSIVSNIQNLKVILENDPSNEKAKRKVEVLTSILSKIEEGEVPFRYQMFILISSTDKGTALESVRVIKRGLEAIGIRCREADEKETQTVLSSLIYPVRKEKTKVTTSFHIPFMTPFSIEKEPNFDLIESGIPIGKEIIHNKLIFWNPFLTSNRHAIVIGPTGSGKTEFLLWLGSLYNLSLDSSVVFFDIKGDIKKRLREYKLPFKVINPLVYSVGSFQEWSVPDEIKVLQLESVISASFRLNRVESSILYKLLRDSVNGRIRSWKEMKNHVRGSIENFDEQNLFEKIFDILDYIEPSSNSNGDVLSRLEYGGINVVDLTLIKSDELKKFIIYTVILRIYNKFSQKITDESNRIAIIVDEAWTLLKDENSTYSIIADIIKKGRGHGISIIMSSQNLEDLGENLPIYIDNSGLLVVLNNGDKEFWKEVKRFMDINDEILWNTIEYLGKGEGVIRFLGDPRPLVVSLFNFIKESH
ncbi:DNA import protein CedB [Sulfuracidifex tepidarius]|uniref:DNA import protein CedB n=1 Tax=Sulfuracidifex tepidarius TaxID=1294262 RepID=A0A510DWH4_9CREN|nr:DNA import protein CedB [Sulfuracidifex tepidarius]BBG24573.1 DNA import protein CedB [Sulfuracidifex tepidarius]